MYEPLTFETAGIITDKRELKTKDKTSTWGRVLKLAVVGTTCDIRVEEDVFNKWGTGQAVRVVGTVVEGFEGRLDLVASKIVAQSVNQSGGGAPVRSGEKSAA